MPAKHETWMPLYIADYLGDTLHLTTEQHGAYLLLLMAAWKRGGNVPDDDAQLAQITRMADRWQTHAAATVRAFFAHREGMLVHDRVMSEITRAESLVSKRSRAGAAGADARWQKDGKRIRKRMREPMANAMPSQCVDDAPSPIRSNTPQPPKGGRSAVSLKTWADAVKAAGEKLIPEDDPVFAYSDDAGIPRDYLDLAWVAFKRRYTVQHPGKRYKDWRRVFRNYVEGNWGRLWFVDDAGGYTLTATGKQAQRALQAAS